MAIRRFRSGSQTEPMGKGQMAEYVANCPRCRASRTTFDVLSTAHVTTRYSWQRYYEAFCLCRHCSHTTTFLIVQKKPDDTLAAHAPETLRGNINNLFEFEGYISQKDIGATAPPDHVPPPLAKIFEEGTKCVAVGCWNAAGAMFRLCVDMATEPLLPGPEENVAGLTGFIRKNLGPRLEWLFKNNRLPAEIAGLSDCIREDGNDAAHRGALGKEDAEDLLDFTTALLERMFTEPERLKLAEIRRQERRDSKKSSNDQTA